MLRNLYLPGHFKTPTERNQAGMIYGLTLLMLVLYTLYSIFVPTAVMGGTYLQALPNSPLIAFYMVSYYGLGIITLSLTSQGRLELAAWGPVLMWLLGPVLSGIVTGFMTALNGMLPVILILIGGLLKGWRGLLFSTFAAVIGLMVGISLRSNFTAADVPPYVTNLGALSEVTVSDLGTMLILLLGTALLIAFYLHFQSISRQEGVREAVAERMITSRIMTKIADLIARREGQAALLDEVVQQIVANFDDVTRAQVYLVDDEGNQATLYASSTNAAQIKLPEAIDIGSPNVVGQALARDEVLVADSGLREAAYQRTVREVVTEVALPLRLGSRVIGVLDLHSNRAGSIDDGAAIAAFEALTDSLVLATDNVGQFERAEQRLQENERLIEETQRALREVERLNERLIGTAWTSYLGGGTDMGLMKDFEQEEQTAQFDETAALQEAIQGNHLVQQEAGDGQVIAMPLRVRGRVIGAMEFELDEASEFGPEDLDLVQEISERFGLAVENARLVDESQRLARRETLVNQITTRLQGTNDIDNMLSEAARGLRDALEAGKVKIRLGTPPDTAENREE